MCPSKDSDQPGHPPSLIRVFTVRLKKAWVLSYPLSAQRRLIRLGVCPGWSESPLGAHAILLVLSWGSSFVDDQGFLSFSLCRLRSKTIEPEHDKTNKILCAQQTLWSEFLLSAWRNIEILATQWVHSKGSDQSLGWAHGSFLLTNVLQLNCHHDEAFWWRQLSVMPKTNIESQYNQLQIWKEKKNTQCKMRCGIPNLQVWAV